MTLIDTSAWIEFFRKDGHRETKTRVATMIELGEAAYCAPVRALGEKGEAHARGSR